MANPHRGDVGFDVAGKTYTLRFSADAICVLEDNLDRGIVAIGEEMATWAKDPGKIRFSFLRSVFWAGLRDQHPDIDIKAAGELMIEAGGMIAAMEFVSKGFERAFPAPAPKTKGARPPIPAGTAKAMSKTMAGTGTGS